MASSFIAFEVINSIGGNFDNGEQLINRDNIVAVQQTAVGTCKILTNTPTATQNEIEVQVSTSKTASIAPAMTSGLITKAVNYALTANPGGVKAKVFLGKDDNGDQMYVRNIVFS